MNRLMLLAPLALAACEIMEGDGNVVRTDRSVDAFRAVEADAFMDVFVEIGDDTAVAVLCDQNLQEHVRTVVIDDRLEVDFADNLSVGGYAACDVYVQTPTLVRAISDGSGDLTVEGVTGAFELLEGEGSGDVRLSGDGIDLAVLKAEGSGSVAARGLAASSLDVELDGSGDVMVEGTADNVLLSLEGSGNVDGQQLAANRADVNLDGSGDIELYVVVHADVNIEGSGSVTLMGPGDHDASIDGSGDVIRR